MEPRGRGRGGEIDPADQWVFNPDTGSYELRTQPAPPHPRQPRDPAAEPYGSDYGSPSPYGPGYESGYDSDYGTAYDTGPDTDHDTDHERAEPRVPGQRGVGAPGGRPSRRKPKPPRSGKRKALMWTGGVMGVVLVAGCTGAYFVWQHFNNNIDKIAVAGQDDLGSTKGRAVNILVIGTDKRSGKGNEGYGDKGSVGHADTNLLFHVSKDRTNATVLSIPRDLITDIPDCKKTQPDGSVKTIPGTPHVRFNTSLGQNGRDPGCTWATVEQITGVQVDHFMMADFNAVKELSNAVGGVDVCLAKPINDKDSKLNLPAGHHTVKGEDALAFVRTRHSVGFGGDLSRIQLQQQFLGSLIRKMKSGDTLTNPKKLWDLGNAATKALTVDDKIGSVRKLLSLAKDLKQVPQKNITFVTLPVIDNPAEKVPVTVVLDKPKAEPIFKMLQADKSMTAKKKKPKKPVKKAPNAKVRVDVLNGGAPPGSAQETLDWLQNSEGMPLSTNSGNAPADLAKTRLVYAPNQADQAATLAAVMGLPHSALKEGRTAAGPREAMKLTLGKDFKAAGTPIAAPDEAPAGVQHVSADDKKLCAK